MPNPKNYVEIIGNEYLTPIYKVDRKGNDHMYPYPALNPYHTEEQYDWYNAGYPGEYEGYEQKPGEHMHSRNPHTGLLLKSPNHPTADLMYKSEALNGYTVYQDLITNREYSFPKDQPVITPFLIEKPYEKDIFEKEEFDKFMKTHSTQHKWNKEDYEYLFNAIQNSPFGAEETAYAFYTEASMNPFAKSKISSAIGLGQLTKANFEERYGKNAESVRKSYENGTVPIQNIIDDAMWYINKVDSKIKTNRNNMGYGRLKVNLLAPNSGLHERVSNKVWNDSLSDEIKKRLGTREVTYEDLMNAYDEEFYENRSKWTN